jgi:hypothetical protein
MSGSTGWMRSALAAAVVAGLWMSGCERQANKSGVESRPAGESATTPRESRQPASAASAPAPATPKSAPASAPASKPAEELPVSTFDTEPPYTVQLYVRKPEDKQPGWLKVLKLEDKHAVAKVRGIFPRQNRMEVQTENVSRLQIELRYLPLAEDKRVVLEIEGHAREITQRDRPFITLERQPTGEWVVEKPPKEK